MKSIVPWLVTSLLYGSGLRVLECLRLRVKDVNLEYRQLLVRDGLGQARLLATNSTTRSPLAPQMPTLAEKIPGFDFAFTVAVLAKTGTPSEVISKVNAEINRIVKVPEVIEQLRTAGVDPAGGTP